MEVWFPKEPDLDTVAQGARFGKVRMKLGRKTKACLPVALEKAMCVPVRRHRVVWAW